MSRPTRGPLLSVCVLGALGLGALGVGPAAGGAATTPSSSAPPAATGSSTSIPSAVLVWARTYEHNIGILADDTLVVVDDGKGSAHPTKKQVSTTIKDCQQWGRDATQAARVTPPIPEAPAQQAWSGMISASLRASLDCTTALLRGSLSSARDFVRQLKLVQNAEAALTVYLGSPGP